MEVGAAPTAERMIQTLWVVCRYTGIVSLRVIILTYTRQPQAAGGGEARQLYRMTIDSFERVCS